MLQWDPRLCSVIVTGSAMPAILACCGRHRCQQHVPCQFWQCTPHLVLSPDDADATPPMQGACGTCASSTATMKMGIERALRVRWCCA